MKTFQLLRRVRLFWTVNPGPPRALAGFRRAAVEAARLARFFYLFSAFAIHANFHYKRFLEKGEPTDPLWPTALLNLLLGDGWLSRALDMPMTVYIASVSVGWLATFFPGVWVWRLGVFLYFFFYVALENSYAVLHHAHHFFVYVSFALLFLPAAAGRRSGMSRQEGMRCIQVFWLAQSVLLLAYSLAGFWKLAGYSSRFALLSGDGFIRVLLDHWVTNQSPLFLKLYPFLVEHGAFSQFLFLGVVYLQASAFVIWFRPHLHRPLGMALIVFHVGSEGLVGGQFDWCKILLGLFLVFSPFSPERFSWFGAAQSLPLLGIPFRLYARSKQRQKPLALARGFAKLKNLCI